MVCKLYLYVAGYVMGLIICNCGWEGHKLMPANMRTHVRIHSSTLGRNIYFQLLCGTYSFSINSALLCTSTVTMNWMNQICMCFRGTTGCWSFWRYWTIANLVEPTPNGDLKGRLWRSSFQRSQFAHAFRCKISIKPVDNKHLFCIHLSNTNGII